MFRGLVKACVLLFRLSLAMHFRIHIEVSLKLNLAVHPIYSILYLATPLRKTNAIPIKRQLFCMLIICRLQYRIARYDIY